jgi:hypothetical protein
METNLEKVKNFLTNVLLLCGCATLLKLVGMNIKSCLAVGFSHRSA